MPVITIVKGWGTELSSLVWFYFLTVEFHICTVSSLAKHQWMQPTASISIHLSHTNTLFGLAIFIRLNGWQTAKPKLQASSSSSFVRQKFCRDASSRHFPELMWLQEILVHGFTAVFSASSGNYGSAWGVIFRATRSPQAQLDPT